jgi:hypothetical protein
LILPARARGGGGGPARRRALLFPLARVSADAVSADRAGPVLLGQAQHDEAPDPVTPGQGGVANLEEARPAEEYANDM